MHRSDNSERVGELWIIGTVAILHDNEPKAIHEVKPPLKKSVIQSLLQIRRIHSRKAVVSVY